MGDSSASKVNNVLSSGKKAVIALPSVVGPEHTSWILATLTEGDAFYREIMKADGVSSRRTGTGNKSLAISFHGLYRVGPYAVFQTR